MGSVISAGLARSHLSNPQAGLRVLKLYGEAVLFSGLGTLFLNKTEISVLNKQQNNNVRNIQRLYKGTPQSFYLLVGGSLPGEAILHLRQLTLFGMICRLEPNNPLRKHAQFVLSYSSGTKYHSWFQQIQNLCKKYLLPDSKLYAELICC